MYRVLIGIQRIGESGARFRVPPDSIIELAEAEADELLKCGAIEKCTDENAVLTDLPTALEGPLPGPPEPLTEARVRDLVEDHLIAKLPDLEQLMQNMVREALDTALNAPTNTTPSEDGAVIGEASPAPAGEVLTPDASPNAASADASGSPDVGAVTSAKRKR